MDIVIDSNPVTIIEISSKAKFLGTLRRCAVLRGIFHDILYVWDANDAIHQSVRDELGIHGKRFIFWLEDDKLNVEYNIRDGKQADFDPAMTRLWQGMDVEYTPEDYD